jgi:hypothetical protein
MNLPGYDKWKTHDPADDCCEFCGADPRHNSNGWQPHCCTGECGVRFRDPDAELEERRDRERDGEIF